MYLNLPSLSNSNYRADIDGIRAIAVLSVIIFHINKAILPGGFIGVDIFFVISGYLITLHILSDIKSNKFSIFDFYKRRIKRIAPVMLVVIASVIICSLVIQRPEDTKEVAKTSIAALFSLSNIYFWLFQDSSYFAQSSEEIPLLHFWSLGVEEQFYIFWPLTLLFFKKSHKKTSFIISLFVISFISFSLGQYIYASSPSFVYYMLPTRGGELLIGSLTAYLVSKKTILTIPSSILFLLSLTGISLIVASLFYFSENIIFPGLYAIIPTTGTAMLILSGHYGTCWIKRILMHRLLVFIGLISYSAYLWHWPLLSFSRYSLIEINLINGILIFITTLIISTASYYFIEKPTRKYNGSVLKTASYLYLIPTIIISSLSFMMYKSDGMFMHRNQNAYEKISVKPAYKYDYVCQRWEIKDEDIKNKKCIIGNAQTEKEPKVLLWGDSNAAHYIGIIGAFSKNANFTFKNLEHSSCPPVLVESLEFVEIKRIDKCRKSLKKIKNIIYNYDVIIMASAWAEYNARSNRFIPSIFETIETLRKNGKVIIILGTVPYVKGYDRVCKEKSIGIPSIICDGNKKYKLDEEIVAINKILKDYTLDKENVRYFDIVENLCSNGYCSAYTNTGTPLYRDSSHLSLAGSWMIGEEITKNISGVPHQFEQLSR